MYVALQSFHCLGPLRVLPRGRRRSRCLPLQLHITNYRADVNRVFLCSLYDFAMGSSHSYVPQPEVFATQMADDNSPHESEWKKFDFIIVGGGMSSIIMAAEFNYLS